MPTYNKNIRLKYFIANKSKQFQLGKIKKQNTDYYTPPDVEEILTTAYNNSNIELQLSSTIATLSAAIRFLEEEVVSTISTTQHEALEEIRDNFTSSDIGEFYDDDVIFFDEYDSTIIPIIRKLEEQVGLLEEFAKSILDSYKIVYTDTEHLELEEKILEDMEKRYIK